MYNITGYGKMIADKLRMRAYVEALRRAVHPHSIVLDIGTGTGIFALLACQFGAHKVYAVDPSDAIQIARESAAANGYAERIEFIQDVSTKITLPERADVIISDLRGVLPCFGRHLPAIIDARHRLLAPEGRLIPQRDVLWVAVADAPDLYCRYTAPSDEDSYGLDMQAARRIAVNRWNKVRVRPEQVLPEPQSWATLDYTGVSSPNVSGAVAWTVSRSGTGHGLLVWFDAMLAEGVTISNSPAEPELIYGSAFFPWPKPVTLAAGDRVSISLHADLIREDYSWRWDSAVQDHSGRVKASFNQSSFFGMALSPARLRKCADSYVPTLNEDGEIDEFVLARMTGQTSLADIARQLSDHFPSRFADQQQALVRASELSEKYSR